MRIPKITSNLYNNESFDAVHEEIDITTLDEIIYDPEIDPENSKTFPRVIKGVKIMCRQTSEYKLLMLYLKRHRKFNRSSIYTGIENTPDKKFTIEIHHAGIVMEDICTTIIIKRLANGESMKYTDICQEIMWLHYAGYIDLVPLDKTTHALIHSPESPEVFIPLQMVDFGDSSLFYKEYKKYIPDTVKANYNYLQDLSMKYERLKDVIPNYMKPKQLYYHGFVKLDKFEELLDEIKL